MGKIYRGYIHRLHFQRLKLSQPQFRKIWQLILIASILRVGFLQNFPLRLAICRKHL